jgi:hypothetical protein
MIAIRKVSSPSISCWAGFPFGYSWREVPSKSSWTSQYAITFVLTATFEQSRDGRTG